MNNQSTALTIVALLSTSVVCFGKTIFTQPMPSILMKSNTNAHLVKDDQLTAVWYDTVSDMQGYPNRVMYATRNMSHQGLALELPDPKMYIHVSYRRLQEFLAKNYGFELTKSSDSPILAFIDNNIMHEFSLFSRDKHQLYQLIRESGEPKEVIKHRYTAFDAWMKARSKRIGITPLTKLYIQNNFADQKNILEYISKKN